MLTLGTFTTGILLCQIFMYQEWHFHWNLYTANTDGRNQLEKLPPGDITPQKVGRTACFFLVTKLLFSMIPIINTGTQNLWILWGVLFWHFSGKHIGIVENVVRGRVISQTLFRKMDVWYENTRTLSQSAHGATVTKRSATSNQTCFKQRALKAL